MSLFYVFRQKPVYELDVLDAQLVRDDFAVERLGLELRVVERLVDVEEDEDERFEQHEAGEPAALDEQHVDKQSDEEQ